MSNVKELSERFQMKPPFIYACFREIALLQPFIHTADKNAKLLDERGLSIFEKIAELKRTGLSTSEIREQLDGKPPETPPETNHFQEKTATKTEKAGVEMAWFRQYADELSKVNEKLDEEREQSRQAIAERETLIRDLIEKNAILTTTLKAFPPPEQQQERTTQAAAIIGELKATSGIFAGKCRKELIELLEKLLLE